MKNLFFKIEIKSRYLRWPILVLALLLILSSCQDSDSSDSSDSGNATTDTSTSTDSTSDSTSDATSDTTAPTVGGSGTITTSLVTENSLDLSWTASSDDTTAASSLSYQVVQSNSNNISTVATAGTNGTVIQSWTAALTSQSVSDLDNTRMYYFNVLVKDESDNPSIYTTKSTSPIGTVFIGETAVYSSGDNQAITQIAATNYGSDQVLIVYSDISDNFYDTYYEIRNSDGTYVTDSKTYLPLLDDSGDDERNGNPVDAATLTNGNIVITYEEFTWSCECVSGHFVMIDSSDGTILSGSQKELKDTSDSGYTTQYLNVSALSGGGFAVAYTSDSKGKYEIYDSSGTLTYGPETFNSGVTAYIDIAPLSNGGFVIAYRDDGDRNEGHYMTFNSSGAATSSEIVFSPYASGSTSHIALAVSADDKLFLAYVRPYDSWYRVIEANGTQGDETRFDIEGEESQYLSAAVTSNNYFLLAYKDSSDTKGEFVLFDSSGTALTTDMGTDFGADNNINNTIAVAVFSNNKIFIGYRDENEPQPYGNFIIVE